VGYFQKLLPGPGGKKETSNDSENHLPFCKACQAKKEH